MDNEALFHKDSHLLGREELIALYETLSPRLFRYAFRLLGDANLAEDCVSETFSRFLQILKSGGGPRENIRAYLYRTAHNWITDFYRSHVPEEALDSGSLEPSVESTVAVVTKNLERERVRSALMKLTPRQRQVVMLRFYEEWPHEEIAALLGETAEAIRALQHRALVGLRKILVGPEE